ncbi:MAG: LacI family DNA-binding transcriptional regulator [Deinococcota bacterium]
MANITDVARRAGVSPTTAKRAINNPELLAPATLKRVKRAIAQLAYEPDQRAAALRSGHSKTIGLIVGNIDEPFFASLIRVISRTLRAQGYTLLVADNEYDTRNELEQLKTFQRNRIAGLILRSGYGKPNLKYVQRMKANDTAVVEVDFLMPESPFSHVMLDNTRCMKLGLEYLHSLGHKRIATLGSYHETILPDERTKAFPELMADLGLAVSEAYERIIHPTSAEAYRITHELMNLPEPPTALFATTGNLASGAFQALRERGLELPQDISLLSFDNYPWTHMVAPAIDVIAQPVEDMSIAAAEMIVREIETPDRPAEQVRFPGTLIKRGSCAAPQAMNVIV